MDSTYRLQIYEGNNKIIEGDFDFITAKSLVPQTDKGIYLTSISSFNEENPVAKEIMVKDGNSYYLPYRLLSSEFQYTDPWLSNKYFFTVFKRTNNQAYNIYIYFPYHFLVSDEISDNDAIQIKDWLNAARIKKQSYLMKVKSEANKAASSYILNTEMLYSMNQTNFTVENERAKIISEMKDIDEQMKNVVRNMQVSNDNIQHLETQLANYRYENEMLKTKINQIGERDQLLRNQFDQLKHQDESKESKKNEISSEIHNDEEEYLKSEQILKIEAPQALKSISSANVKLFVEKSIEGTQEKLREVLS
jgi:type II secretory pathway component PulJ